MKGYSIYLECYCSIERADHYAKRGLEDELWAASWGVWFRIREHQPWSPQGYMNAFKDEYKKTKEELCSPSQQ